MKIPNARQKVPKRSVTHGNWKTSVTLDDEFWEGFKEIAWRQRVSLGRLAWDIKSGLAEEKKLSGAIRLYVLQDARNH